MFTVCCVFFCGFLGPYELIEERKKKELDGSRDFSLSNRKVLFSSSAVSKKQQEESSGIGSHTSIYIYSILAVKSTI
jgi:hypothetical protein